MFFFHCTLKFQKEIEKLSKEIHFCYRYKMKNRTLLLVWGVWGMAISTCMADTVDMEGRVVEEEDGGEEEEKEAHATYGNWPIFFNKSVQLSHIFLSLALSPSVEIRYYI